MNKRVFLGMSMCIYIQTGKPPLRFQLYSDRTEDYSQFAIEFGCKYIYTK